MRKPRWERWYWEFPFTWIRPSAGTECFWWLNWDPGGWQLRHGPNLVKTGRWRDLKRHAEMEERVIEAKINYLTGFRP